MIACYDHLPKFGYTPVTSLQDQPDVILMIDPRPDGISPSINEIAYYKSVMKERVAVVHRINECDARKGTNDVDDLLLKCQRYVDERVFVSQWLSEHLRGRWANMHPSGAYAAQSIYGGVSNDPVIYNGVDTDLFHPEPVTGDKIKIVTHHWSAHALKGADVTRWLDEYFIPKHGDRYEYTYIGRLGFQLKNSLMIPACHGKALASVLAPNHIYVSGSRWDPGPNHCLEAMACGLEIFVHADGGGAVEFAGKESSYSSLEELEKMLLGWNGQNPRPYPAGVVRPWHECVRQYATLFDELTSHMP